MGRTDTLRVGASGGFQAAAGAWSKARSKRQADLEPCGDGSSIGSLVRWPDAWRADMRLGVRALAGAGLSTAASKTARPIERISGGAIAVSDRTTARDVSQFLATNLGTCWQVFRNVHRCASLSDDVSRDFAGHLSHSYHNRFANLEASFSVFIGVRPYSFSRERLMTPAYALDRD